MRIGAPDGSKSPQSGTAAEAPAARRLALEAPPCWAPVQTAASKPATGPSILPHGNALTAGQIAEIQQKRDATNKSLTAGPLDLSSKEGRRTVRSAEEVLSALAKERGAPNAQFIVRSAEVDSMGMTHVRLKQTFIGPSAFDQEIIVHIAKTGIVHVTNRTETFENLAPLKSWTVPRPMPPRKPDNVTDSQVTALQSRYNGNVEVVTARSAQDGGVVLRDGTRGAGVVTRDLERSPVIRFFRNSRFTALLNETDDTRIDVSGEERVKGAVDTHYAAEMTHDFFRDILERNSIDGRGERLLLTVDPSLSSAEWTGVGVVVGNKTKDRSYAALDVVAHELVHGLVARTASLEFGGEAGAIDEGMADVLGTGVEWYTSFKNKNVQFNYRFGECAAGSSSQLRDLRDPREEFVLDHVKFYSPQTERHVGSGIVSNAFFLIAEGGENRTARMLSSPDSKVPEGIGIEKAVKIFGRALMFYMTPTTTFAEARAATLNATRDLYGAESREAQIVGQGWAAVGV